MVQFEDSRERPSSPRRGEEVDAFSGLSVKGTEELRNFHSEKSTLTVLREVREHPERFPFSRLQALADFMKGESLARSFPGAARPEVVDVINPEPIDTPFGAVFQGHRFAVLRSNYDPDVVINVSMAPNFVELDRGVKLTEALAQTPIGERRLIKWSLRVPVGHSIEVARQVLDRRRFELRDGEAKGVARFGDGEMVSVGTTQSLGLVNLPGRILMVDSRCRYESALTFLAGGWWSDVSRYAEGAHLKARFERNRGILRDESVVVVNEGNVPFRFVFDDSRRE